MKSQGLSLADARSLFEGLTGDLPQSASELKAVYRAWMKTHHPDITGSRDPLSLEAVQWMNAAYDLLKAHPRQRMDVRRETQEVWSRPYSPIPVCPGEGRLTRSTAGLQLEKRELALVPEAP